MKKNKFQLKREVTYANLIQAGMEVLSEKGYSTSSIDDVVGRAGYTKGAFYVHFESKEQFFLHLADHQAGSRQTMLTEIANLQGEALTLEQAVSSMVGKLIAYINQTPEWILVYMDFFIQSKRSELIQAKFREIYGNWIMEGKRFIDLLKRKQLIPGDTDSEEKVKMMYAFMDGCISHHVFYKERLDEQMISGVFVKMLQK